MRSQRKYRRRRAALLFAVVCVIAIAGFLFARYDNSIAQAPEDEAVVGVPTESPAQDMASIEPEAETQEVTPSPSSTPTPTEKPAATQTPKPDPTKAPDKTSDIAVVAQPESITALVNKQNKLPENYKPSELVYPDVAFLFSEKIDKRKMRKEAADALEELFAAAKKDDIYLAGVSAYRSHSTQKSLFERYVKKDGMEKALTYSAYPGTSEHETGLAIDVSGSDGKCAAESCFGGTDEALWLDKHAPEYGFIIRYPEGKQAITGYKYEPWHLRYVGTELAAELDSKDLTLEEYYNAVPVSQ